MKVSDQIKHECQIIINIMNLCKPNQIDVAQLHGCMRRLKELAPLFDINYDMLQTIGEC